MALQKGPFSKGFDQNYSTEVYKIVRRLRFMDPVQYKLSTLDDEEVKGKYYAGELVKATPRDDELYEIEKIVDQRMRNGKKQVKVRWKDFGPSHDQWLYEKDLIDLPGLKPSESNVTEPRDGRVH